MKNKKSLGQNWLKNRVILEEIAELVRNGKGGASAEQSSEKTEIKLCVEIGPGLGFLTSSLLKRFDKVIAVEYDEELARKLPGSFPGKSLEVVNQDILEFDFENLKEPYVVAGNIPYYITSPIIRKILTLKHKPERVVLLVQKEVAERIVNKKETILSLFVKNYAKVCADLIVSKEEFVPSPKVDSQVVIMEPYGEPVVGEEVFELIRVGFNAPRKKLIHNLASICPVEKLESVLIECELSRDVRPGDLELDDWANLHKKLLK